jgi:hypothetical protein
MGGAWTLPSKAKTNYGTTVTRDAAQPDQHVMTSLCQRQFSWNCNCDRTVDGIAERADPRWSRQHGGREPLPHRLEHVGAAKNEEPPALSRRVFRLNSRKTNRMDKRKKTKWEKRMRLWMIALIILLPLLFGFLLWLISHLNRY